jgi:predicted Zn finger-like uncharacterized protein
MPLVIQCPQCAKRYQVADHVAGKHVRCQQCQTSFAARPAPTPATAPLAPPDPFALPAAPSPLGPAVNPLGAPAAGSLARPVASSPGFWQPGTTNPSGGPTDFGMRLGSGGMLALGLVISIGSLVLQASTGTVYVFAVAMAPLMLILGIAGLISPNVVRAVGKYGGHLPWQYKAIGWGLMGLYFVILVLLMVGLFVAGFEPERPGRPGRRRAAIPGAFESARVASWRIVHVPAGPGCGALPSGYSSQRRKKTSASSAWSWMRPAAGVESKASLTSLPLT